jgi:hypothetical protein
MNVRLVNLTYDIELQPGETLTLPDARLAGIGPGRWRMTLQPLTPGAPTPIRDHRAFLSGFSPEDEGLYDDQAR